MVLQEFDKIGRVHNIIGDPPIITTHVVDNAIIYPNAVAYVDRRDSLRSVSMFELLPQWLQE